MIIFDIETAANSDLIPHLPRIKVPGTMKKESTIVEYLAEEKEKQIDNMALNPDFARISAVGIYDKKSDQFIYVSTEPVSGTVSGVTLVNLSERELLSALWGKLYADNRIIGFNCNSFDFPMMMRRSMALGILPKFIPDLRKYTTREKILDLFAVLNNWNIGIGLKSLAKVYGLKPMFDDLGGDLTGKDFALMDDITRVKYTINDVWYTYQLYNKMLGIYFI